jgi:mono/diheme cytochrome c family protein
MSTPLVMVLAVAAWAGDPGSGDAASEGYLRDVKPVLARRCYACHGALKKKAGLRLDTGAGIREGGDGGPAVEPGHADESLLIDRLTDTDPSFRMPPEGEPLSADEVAKVRAWIEAGAASPADEAPQKDPREHWAFRPPVRPTLPPVADQACVRNPIDAFLAAEHARRGLKPAPPSDPATLLRRVTLDLTGLAPTPEALRAFLADPSEAAYEEAVERLLASPAFGERWGRHWMDVWRYSDWYGFQAEVRHSQPHIWRWRDWIVESLNEDKGYDRMVVEMLAGDEVAPDDPDSLRATGYLVRNWFKFNRNVWLQDTVDHTAKAFLGITFNCARCHDHKYDPIAQTDYYRLRAFFEPHDIRTDRLPGQPDTAKDGLVRVYDAHAETPTYLFVRGEDMQPDKDRPLTPGLPGILGSTLEVAPQTLPPSAHYPALRPHVRAETIAAAESVVAKAKTDLDAALNAVVAAEPGTAERDRAEQRREAALKGLTAALADLASIRARIEADDARFATQPDSKRADIAGFLASRAERRAAILKAEAEVAQAASDLAQAEGRLPADPKARGEADQIKARAEQARKRLAELNAAPAKFATAYTPIVPAYPATSTGRRLALARWIVGRENPTAARVAVNHVWMRHFGEPLVPTVFDFGNNGKPPSHPELLDWLAVELMDHGWSLKHLHRLIVTSHAYRMRSSAPADDPNVGIDPANRYLWRMNPRRMEAELVRDNLLHAAGDLDPALGGPELDQATALATHRRSLYYRHAPEKQAVFLQLFDAANTTACYRRDMSIVPQQALALANSTLALAESRRLASKLSEEAGPDDEAFIGRAFVRVLGREPSAEERSACAGFLASQAERLSRASSLTPFADGPPCPVPAASDPKGRAREGLVHVLVNHNDFVTIR